MSRCRELFGDESKDYQAEIDRHYREGPPEGWEGEEGRIGAAVLARHLPERYQSFQYFICGPDPLMDAVEGALVELGVPDRRVHSERFAMV